jgi:anti-sigma B factor antagonist
VTIRLEGNDEVAVLSLIGDIDMEEVVDIKNAIASIMSEGCYALVLDLNRVQHINVTGIGILIDSLHRLRALRGDLRLCHLNPYLRHVLEIMGLTRIFRIFENRETAISSFKTLKYAAA